jgi:rare lipoprotein A
VAFGANGSTDPLAAEAQPQVSASVQESLLSSELDTTLLAQLDSTSVQDSSVVLKTQKGKITYYGMRFHGRRTASGQKHNAYAYVAAHRTLPFGTKIRVTVPKTGKSLIVTVNDRGPFGRGMVLDVSNSAARVLGIERLGVAQARLEILAKPTSVAVSESRTPAAN